MSATLHATLQDFGPVLALILFGFLPNEVWRLVGLILVHGLDEKSQIIVWVRAVATAMLAGVLAQLILSTSSIGSYALLSNLVAVSRARCPPAEKPPIPIWFGSILHSLALLRTRLTALWASRSGPCAGSFSGSPRRRGTRYLRTIPVMPTELSHSATSVPSKSQARFQ